MNRAASTVACTLGMALGLWLDTRGVPLDLLASWCGDPDSAWRAIARHWSAMPASHALMGAGALLVPGRLPGRLACAGAMLLAMSAGGLLAPALARLAGLTPGIALLAAMGGGMLAGACLLPARCPGQPVTA